MRFVVDIKSGKDEVEAPIYSHLVYDVVPGEKVVVKRPDIVIIEGLNVLQPARVRDDGRAGLAVSDFFDFSVYVDAAVGDIKRWYVERFLRLRETAFQDPLSYFRKYAMLSEDEAAAEAGRIWDAINGPNLVENVAPTRGPRHPGAAQGLRPLGALRAAAQALTSPGTTSQDLLQLQQGLDAAVAERLVDGVHVGVDLGVAGVDRGAAAGTSRGRGRGWRP